MAACEKGFCFIGEIELIESTGNLITSREPGGEITSGKVE